jgi:preprotein translocase subunit SecD
LRGGSHLLLELDTTTYLREHLETLRDGLRNALRKEAIGYLDLQASTDAVTLRVRSETLRDGQNIAAIISTLDADVSVEEVGGVTRVFYSPAALKRIKARLITQSIEIVNRRVNESGTKEPIVQRQGLERIIVQVPGLKNPEQLKQLLGKTARMTFHLVNESVGYDQIASAIVPSGTRIVTAEARGENADMGQPNYAIYSEVALSGELLTGANATYQDGASVVSFQFNTLGARKFGAITSENVGNRFAVLLDDKVITAPVIRGPITGGSGIIEGNFTAESANQLAMLLRAGALPAPLNIIEERSVGPSLGQDSIDAGTLAAFVAVCLIVVFMTLSYGVFGIFANIALLMNMVILVGVLSLMQATLTLPGIAGMVLTMGMAVDANVLIFERIRDEIQSGKSPIASIESGFRVAFGTIFDSNLTTLIAAGLLFYFGSGTVKGFAVTLSVGIISSMFTAVMCTKLLIVWWVRMVKPKRVPI